MSDLCDDGSIHSIGPTPSELDRAFINDEESEESGNAEDVVEHEYGDGHGMNCLSGSDLA
jgi:hypothetical protein